MIKKCTKCNKNKHEKEFHYKKTENRYNSWCKECVYEFQRNRWQLLKLKAINLFQGKCSICGYNKNIAAMEFHHINPEYKEYSWTKMRLLKWGEIVEELKKCVLLCSNCHRELHNPKWEIKETQQFIDDFKYDGLLDRDRIQTFVKMSPSGTCPICGEEVFGTKYCSIECSAKSKRKVLRPSKEELDNKINNMSFCAIGREYGVSDNAIRKWAKQYELI